MMQTEQRSQCCQYKYAIGKWRQSHVKSFVVLSPCLSVERTLEVTPLYRDCLAHRGLKGGDRICSSVLAQAAHIINWNRYREDQHGPCERMTRKFVKRFHIFIYLHSSGANEGDVDLMCMSRISACSEMGFCHVRYMLAFTMFFSFVFSITQRASQQEVYSRISFCNDLNSTFLVHSQMEQPSKDIWGSV